MIPLKSKYQYFASVLLGKLEGFRFLKTLAGVTEKSRLKISILAEALDNASIER